MIKSDFNKALCSLFFLLYGFIAAAQSQTSVKAAIDKNRILIGEHIRLSLEVNVPENEPIRFFSIDSLPHFELLNKEPIDTTNTRSGTILKQVIRITSFDSGHWVIPSFILGGKIATDTIPVDVSFSPFDPTQDYHDIKDIMEVPPPAKRKTWWWWAAGILFIVILVLIYLLVNKKKPEVIAPVLLISPYAEAMEQLEKLKRENPEQKQYYSRIVDILRIYIFKKKGILSFSRTTDDLVKQMKTLEIGKDQFEKLSQALRLSDFVKFAKYTPSADDNKDVFETIEQTIKEIEQIQ